MGCLINSLTAVWRIWTCLQMGGIPTKEAALAQLIQQLQQEKRLNPAEIFLVKSNQDKLLAADLITAANLCSSTKEQLMDRDKLSLGLAQALKMAFPGGLGGVCCYSGDLFQLAVVTASLPFGGICYASAAAAALIRFNIPCC